MAISILFYNFFFFFINTKQNNLVFNSVTIMTNNTLNYYRYLANKVSPQWEITSIYVYSAP